ncbi:MAG: OmpA family protein [bacterium]
MNKKLLTLLLLFFIGISFSGCAKPPKEERAMAEKAFRQAAVGRDCDRENYLAAEELLKKARESWNNKNYKESKKLFEAVKEKSDAVVEYYRTHPDECLPQEEEEETDKIEEEVPEVLDPVEDPDMVFPVIHFEFDRHEIRAEDESKLDDMAQWMKNFPEVSIRVEGHTDERGSVDYNMALGEKRALAVLNALVQRGIDKERLSIISYGEERPVDTRSNEDAWFENRRAEFKRMN